MRNACVLIPAYNEAKTIGEIVKVVKGYGFDAVVVDDGSIDMTSKLASEAGAFVIKNSFNLGKGASLRKGIRHILSEEYNAVIIMDGDGQHSPDEICKFVEMAEREDSSFIIGNRMGKPAAMPLIRFITNNIMSMIISIICKQDIADTQCGYKFIRRDVLEKLNLISSNYDIESEMLIEAAGIGIRLDSMTIKSIYMEEESKIKPFVDTLRFIRLLARKALKRKTS